MQFDQSGLTFERDHYLDEGKTIYHAAFVQYFTAIVELLGGDSDAARRRADEIFQFETKIAEVRQIHLRSIYSERKGTQK